MMDTPTIRLMIVDDHPVVRQGLAMMLNLESNMEVIAEAGNGREALEMYRVHRPDVTLMDLRMPDMDGIEAVTAIREEFPTARIILLTTYDADEGIFRGLHAGARSYLMKDAPYDEVLTTICAVHSGQKRISMEVGAKLAERAEYPDLTEREMDVLRLMVKGHSNLEIGTALYIAEGTVKFHVNHILNKLNVADRTHAVITALRRGLASID